MNQKSLFLTLLLLGGLFTPQETRPIFLVVIPEIAAMISGAATTATIYNAFYPSRVASFLTDQDRIKSYKALVTTYKKEKRKKIDIAHQTITASDPYYLIKELNTISQNSFYYNQNSFIRITLTVILTNNRNYILNPIEQKKYSERKLTHRLVNALLVPKNIIPNNIKYTLLSFGWIFTTYHKLSNASLYLLNAISIGTYFA
ncbi:MAG: hypothetical protein ACJAZS_000339 [Alteromonas naphthalenivorans]|jgi:hypothetical protein